MTDRPVDQANDVPRGCECDDCLPGSGCAHEFAPVWARVERDGEEINVCTRCDVPSDEILEILVDGDTSATPYMDYDPLGAVCIPRYIDEHDD